MTPGLMTTTAAKDVKTKPEPASVKAAARTFDLLEAFAVERRALSLSQLAKLLNVPVSSCHQLVGTLEARGYLYTVGRRRQIYPTGKILGIARAIVAHDPWMIHAVPQLQELRTQTRETVLLGKRQGRHVIYLMVEEGTEAIRFTASVGDRKPLHLSSLGMALLGSLGDHQRDELLAEMEERYRTTTFALNEATVTRELAIGRERGWYVLQGGREFDVMAIGISFEISGESFAIGVAGPLQRVVPAKGSFAAALLATRAAIIRLPEVAVHHADGVM